MLFDGSVLIQWGNVIRGEQCLFEGVVFLKGWCLFEGCIYLSKYDNLEKRRIKINKKNGLKTKEEKKKEKNNKTKEKIGKINFKKKKIKE